MMSRRLICTTVAVALFSLLCAGGVIGYIVFPLGAKITVGNVGEETMREVTVHVTGRMYAIGDIAPGSFRSQRVSPTGESIVEVEFTDEQGRRVRLNAGGYLEPGCRGQIDIEIRDGQVVAVKDKAAGVSY